MSVDAIATSSALVELTAAYTRRNPSLEGEATSVVPANPAKPQLAGMGTCVDCYA